MESQAGSVFNADTGSFGTDTAGVTPAVSHIVLTAPDLPRATPARQALADPTRIVFIEANVPDVHDLLDGLRPCVEAVLLDPAQDGVQRIAAYLASHDLQGLAGIDIVAHGAAGEIRLGTATLGSTTLAEYQSALARIGAALAPGGAIQIYGCDVGRGQAGVAFLDQLSQATGGANIAAASHLVGGAAWGGSFDLDVRTGAIAVGTPFTSAALDNYQGALSDSLTYGQTIDEAGIVATSETVAAGVMTLENSGGTVVGTITVGTSLSTGDFLLQPDGSGGTDVIVDTVFGTYTAGITLLVDPTTIAATGEVTRTTGLTNAAVGGPAGTTWTLTNYGLISDTAPASYGVSFGSGGTIINAGSIYGSEDGILLTTGGSVINQSGGTIAGYYGILAQGAQATVVNAGTIAGNYTLGHDGVYLGAGGSVTNQSGGTISGRYDGIKISGASGTVDNLGRVQSNDIVGQGGQYGVYLANGGVVTNGTAGGTASSAYILGYGLGVKFGPSGTDTLINYGTISGNPGARAVSMTTGTLINGPSGATGALIEGGGQRSGIGVSGAGTVVNYGTILGPELNGDTTVLYGVSLGGAGSISNLGSQSLIESYLPVYAAGNATVTNAGTLDAQYANGGPASHALVFGDGTNRLIIDPGAVFVGTVSGSGAVTLSPGGNTQVIGTANGVGTTTMELASGASAGTLSGLGTNFVNFATLTFDSGAQWTVTGNDSASGLGTLDIGGLTYGDTIDLTGFAAVSRTFASNSLLLGNGSGSYATLAIQSDLATANFGITSDGDGGTDITMQPVLPYGDTIDETGVVAASETVSAGTMTLFSGAGIAVGTIDVGTSLSSGDFTLTSDGSGGTDVIVDTVFGTYTSGVTLLTDPTTIASTASISSTTGSALSGAGGSTSWTITNYGVVNGGTSGNGIQLGSGGANTGAGSITNAAGGTITGRYGIRLYNDASFSIVNLAGGTIAATGTNADRAIDLESGVGTVTNSGLIIAQTSGAFDVGVELDGGGTVINTASGTISGGWGVLVSGAGTVINAGTISGVYTNEYAVTMNGGDRLIVDPGAVFIGAVNGGRGGGASTLELASAASAGTLAATDFTNFNTIEFDTGAAWTLQGGTNALSGTIDGFTFGDTIDLTGFAAVNRTFASDSLVLGNGSGGFVTLAIQGDFATGNFSLTSDGDGGTDINLQPVLPYGDTIDQAGIVATSETVAAGVMTLENSGGTVVGTVAVGDSLSSGDFLLAPDGSGGTDVIVDTVFGTYTSGITLLTDPTTIASTAAITGSADGASGVYGPTGTTWTLTNLGTVSETGLGSYGISFASGGTIINAASAVVAGYQNGVVANAAITVVNGGSIGSDLLAHGSGVNLGVGGSVSNQSGGTISGYYGVAAEAAATVVNAGVITGHDGPAQGAGVFLLAGGSVTNQSGGTISGYFGVEASSVAATVVNAGVIAGNYTAGNGDGVSLGAGGSVTNQSSGTISGHNDGIRISGPSATVDNLGRVQSNDISGTGGQAGVYLAEGGIVTNGTVGGTASSAYIVGYHYGVKFGSSGTDTLINYGTVSVSGDPGAPAVSMTTGTLINGPGGATGALIEGGDRTSGVLISGAATVINYGTIVGIEDTGDTGVYYGVRLGGAGSISNLGSTSLIESYVPVYAQQNATVTNAGTLDSEGPGSHALVFGGGTNRLIIDPGAVFIGTVSGGGAVTLSPNGNTQVIGTANGTGTTTMELATGASAGTLSGLGTQFVGFAAVTIDSGAQWTLAGYNTLASGVTLTNSGTLTDSGTFINAGLVTSATQGILLTTGAQLTNQSSGTITGTEGISASGAASVVNAGSIGGSSDDGIILHAGGPVTNQSSGTITGPQYGIKVDSGVGTVSNAGYIGGGTAAVQMSSGSVTNLTGGVITAEGFGVRITADGFVTNASGGSIIGGADGVYSYSGPFSLVNSGTIDGAGTGALNGGVYLWHGGAVSNTSGGSINGYTNGVIAFNNPATISNAGTIAGTHAMGVQLDGGGSVSNASGGTIVGSNDGVYAKNGTVTNAGTIESNMGASGTAVAFAGSNARLIDDPGAVFIGGIDGGTGGTAVLELASAASAGTISGFGGSITNFGSLVFDAGAQWTVAGNDNANGLGTLGITGFTAGDTIDLTGFAAVSRTFSSNALVLGNGVGSYETLNIQGSFATDNFGISSDGDGGTDITLDTPPAITAAGTVSFTGGGSAVALDDTVSITSASGTLAGATVSIGTGFLPGDTLTFTADFGITGTFDASTGTLALSGNASDADYQAVLDTVAYDFTPSNGDPTDGGTDDSRTIDWVVNDGTVDSTAAISNLDVNEPPAISGTVAGQATTDEATRDPFSGVTITDPNISQTETVTITLSNAANGTLSNLDGGTFNNGTYVVTGSPSVVTTAIDGLVFTPTAHEVAPGDTVATTFTISVTDTLGNTASDTTTTVIATAVNDPPAITQTGTNVGVPNENPVTPFAGLTVTDPDIGHTDTLTVVLSPTSGGTLSNLGGGTFNNGTYVVTGTPSAVTTALDGLAFTAAAPSSGSDVSSTTDFSITVTGPGGSDSNDAISATAVSQVDGLGSASPSDDNVSISSDGSSFPDAVDGDNNEAVVTDPTSGSTYDLPTGYQAEFLGGTAGATLSDPSGGGALLVGNSGNDTLTAAAGLDTLVAGTGDNLLSVHGAGDVVDAGGTSTVDAGGANETVLGSTGAATVSATGSDAVVLGHLGALSVFGSGNGDTIAAFGASSAAVSLSGSLGVLLGGSNALTATVSGSDNTVAGGSGSSSATLSGSNDLMLGGTGSLSVYDSGMSDTIAAFSASSAAVSLDGSSALLFGGSNAITVSGNGATDTIVGGSGAASIAIATIGIATDDEVLGWTGALTIDDEGQGDTIASFAASSANVTLGSSSEGDRLFGGTGTLNVSIAGSNDTVVGGSGPATIDASSGAVVFGGSGALSFVGGGGTSTILGASGGAEMVTVGSGGVLFFAGASDNPTITGGSGVTTVVGGAGSGVVFSSLSGSGGLDYLAGSGNESLDAAGSSSSNVLGFFDASMSLGGGAQDTVSGWTSQDLLVLMGYDSTQVSTVGGGGNFTVDLTHGATITFTDAGSAAFAGRIIYGGVG